jgi:hypothetical protein
VAERHLRAIDGAGEVVLGDFVPSDYQLLIEQNAKHLRTIAALKGQLSRLAKVDPQAATVERILVAWRNRCYGPTSRIDVSVDGKRGDVVRKTLRRLIEADDEPELADPDKAKHAEAMALAEGRAVERIMAAIDGASKFPFEGAYGRRFAEAGPGLKKKVDIAYVLRDGPKMEQFEDLVEADARRIAYAAELWRMVQSQPNLRLVLASFGPEPCGEILARLVRWCCANS